MPTGSDERVGVYRVAAKFVPRILQLTRSSSASTSALNFVSLPPTMKPSCPGSTLVMRAETKQQSFQWKDPTLSRPKKARQMKSNVKNMIITFFDIKGIVLKKFVPTGQTVNSGFYYDVLRRLRKNVRRRSPEIWREHTWLLHHEDAPYHTSVFIQQFLTKNETAVIPHPP
jgi:hypothetical protein